VRNLCLMVFNLIPIPPLDGSKILGMFLPNRTYYNILQYEQYAIILIMALSFMGAFDVVIGNSVLHLYEWIINMVEPIIEMAV